MKFIIGKKIEMTQIWKGDDVVAVTKVQAEPCRVVQVKTDKIDGYSAVQLGFGVRKEKNISKPQKGHTKDLGNYAKLREFRISAEEAAKLKRGDVIGIETFAVNDKVEVEGVSKGKGFQGVVKRHGFSGSKKTHGNKDQERMTGSSGATGPAHVFKGTRKGGRTGGDQVTTKNLKIAEIDAENNILYVKGAIAGARNGMVLISGEGELIIRTEEVQAEEVKTEEAAVVAEVKEEIAVTEAAAPAVEAEKKAETPEEVEKEVIEAKEKVDQKQEEK